MQLVPQGFVNPAGLKLPVAFHHVLEVQAMFPVTSRDEMRGEKDDLDEFGNRNELALIDDDDEPAIWRGLDAAAVQSRGSAQRERAQFIAVCSPRLIRRNSSINLASNTRPIAIAAYERSAFTLLDSPWDRYVAGDAHALTPAAKRGAGLFFGKPAAQRVTAAACSRTRSTTTILVPPHRLEPIDQQR